MDITVLDMPEGITVFTKVDNYPSQVNTMYIDEKFYGIKGLYVNRLIVAEPVRGRGIATKLMEALVEKADEKQINVVLEINAYGDLNRDELEVFYGKFGFNKSNIEGLYVRQYRILV